MTQRISASVKTKNPDETVLVRVDFTLYGLDLDTDEKLTGTPTITTPSGITASNPSVNISAFKNDRGRTVAVGKGVIFTLTGGTAGETYRIDVSCTTDGSPAQTLKGPIYVEVKEYD